jgi:hypothetical protein
MGVNADTEFPVTVGRSYHVYAVTIFLGIAWYYILNDDQHPWPTWTPAPLFDVKDGSLPASWRFGYFRFSNGHEYPILSFPEWSSDHAFYERLVDGEAEEVQIFEKRRREVEALPGSL